MDSRTLLCVHEMNHRESTEQYRHTYGSVEAVVWQYRDTVYQLYWLSLKFAKKKDVCTNVANITEIPG
jgi:hypothetical protein